MGRAAAFVLLLVVGLGLLGLAGDRISPVHHSAGFEALRTRAADGGPTAIAIGNSHTVAIDFGAMGIDGLAIWQGNADAFEMAALGHAILERFPAVRTILLPVSPEFLYTDHTGTGHPTRVAIYDHLYALSHFRPIEGDPLGWARWAGSFLLRPDEWRTVWRVLFAGGSPARQAELRTLAPRAARRAAGADLCRRQRAPDSRVPRAASGRFRGQPRPKPRRITAPGAGRRGAGGDTRDGRGAGFARLQAASPRGTGERRRSGPEGTVDVRRLAR